MQPAGELDSSGQSASRDDFARGYSSTRCIQIVEDEANPCCSLFGFGESGPDLFVGFSKDEFVNLILPVLPKLPPLLIQFMLLWWKSL
jgi:hypothetical protein